MVLTTSRRFLAVCCHVRLHVCAEVLKRSLDSLLGSIMPASFTYAIAPHVAGTLSLLPSLRIYQSEQFNLTQDPNLQAP